VISLTFDDLRKIKPVIAVGGGEDKVSAILGALRTRCIDIIITDERTAQKVLVTEAATAPKPEPAKVDASLAAASIGQY
jgi:DNA-binding transcriptional regulator LsrR (DeoR family)